MILDDAHRVLDLEAVGSLDDHLAAGGGAALSMARRSDPARLIDIVEDAGLRGRGGAGFPTGVKWRTVALNRSPAVPSTVVVNGAEGEPGTFKDRALLRQNPFRVLEGALIAAHAVGADTVVVGLKASFEQELGRTRQAIAEMEAAELDGEDWTGGVEIAVVEGPEHYLFGEETALLETIEGRQPFPRVAPPHRAGLEHGEPGDAVMAAAGSRSSGAPVLANNVETLANVPGIVANGADWYRSVGTSASPGTVVCTLTGRVREQGVIEVPMGTPLSEVIDQAGGGALAGRRIVAALSGTANPVLTGAALDAPLCYDAMRKAGGGLGAAGFIVLDDATDIAQVAHGVSRFLAVESCGQCTPCKADGLAIAAMLDEARAGGGAVPVEIGDRLATVTDGARCYLATQHADVVGSLMRAFPAEFDGSPRPDGRIGLTIAPIVELDGGEVVVDATHAAKQPDWTHDERDSGAWPAQRLDGGAPETEPGADASGPGHGPGPGAAERTGPAARAAGADGTEPDPGGRLVAAHRRIEALLERAVEADGPTGRNEVVDELDRALRDHADVAERVLYPLVSRHTGGVGDWVGAATRRHGEAAVRLADELVALAGDADGETWDRLVEQVRLHLVESEGSLVPLMRAAMTGEELEHLDAALAEAETDIVR